MNKIAILFLIAVAVYWWMKAPTISVLGGDIEFTYQVEYPAGDASGSRLPMLIALHGNGDTPKNFFKTGLNQLKASARVILLKGPFNYAGGGAWTTSDPAHLKLHSRAVAEAADALSAEYPTLGKPLLLGFSGGGEVAYYQAVVFGDRYSYIFPISGRLSEQAVSGDNTRAGAAVYAFHGKQDNVLSFNGGQQAANLLTARNVQVQFTPFEGSHLGMFLDMKPTISKLVDEKIRKIR